MNKPRVLIVDDEETIRHILVSVIEENGCEVRAAGSAEDALAHFPGFIPAVALVDIVLPGKSGLELLSEIKRLSPDTEVVMITSHASAETALQAIKEGAYTYLQKPFENLEEIWSTVQRALEKRSLTQKNRSLLRDREERSVRILSDVSLVGPAATPEDHAAYAEILEYFMDMVTRELRVDHAVVMLLDEKAGVLRVGSHRGETTIEPKSVQVRLGDGISGFVARTGDPCVPGASLKSRVPTNGARLHPSEKLFSDPIALCVPIRSDRSVLGVFAATGRKTGKLFNDGDVNHVVALAGQLAVAIAGARRADRLEKAYESLKTTQEQLIRNERIKAIGHMAAGVAHDFNNSLSIILARAEFIHANLTKGTFDKEKTRVDLERIIKTALQGAETIKRIQNYTRIRKDEPRAPVDLNDAVRDAIEMTQPKWKQEAEKKGRTIDVHLELADVPKVAGNIYELTQVVENLIFNSVEAMPQGGRLSFRTTQVDGSVVLEACDTGLGMDEDTRRHLFEPFFTTRQSGQGLGTSIIYGIITRHKGNISVDSKIGSGTTFRITLPAYVPTSDETLDQSASVTDSTRSARILLVDDEEGVRDAYREALVSSGHEVVAVSGGQEALSVFHKGEYGLVITDLSMGEMSGYEFAQKVKQIDPHVPVILLSGWAVGQGEVQVRNAGIRSILIKPCRLDDLRSAVQNALRGSTQPGH